MYLGRLTDIEAGEHLARPVDPKTDTLEERLLGTLRWFGNGPSLLNPISPTLSLGRGPGTLPASFGITLDPALNYAPKGRRALNDVLAEGMPDPRHSGIIPEMLDYIELVQRHTPDWLRISLPDMQGPFNIAHMVLGDEAFYAPFDAPEQFRQVMELITDFFIALHRQLEGSIDPARRCRLPVHGSRIAECSVNLLSRDTYLEACVAPRPAHCRVLRAGGDPSLQRAARVSRHAGASPACRL